MQIKKPLKIKFKGLFILGQVNLTNIWVEVASVEANQEYSVLFRFYA